MHVQKYAAALVLRRTTPKNDCQKVPNGVNTQRDFQYSKETHYFRGSSEQHELD
jgi:hypothetical protein